MITFHRLLLSLCFFGIFPFQVYAEAPVVDDSENFAILDEQQAAIEQPVAKTQLEDNSVGEEIALAHDNFDTGSNNDNANLLNKLHGLQQDIQELRGQLEVQTHDLKLLQQQQLAFYKDLDTRLRNNPTHLAQTAPTPEAAQKPLELGIENKTIETSSSLAGKPKLQDKVAAAPIPTGVRTTNPASEQVSYLAAYDLVKSKRFEEALNAMQSFVQRYPRGGYTANAEYWLGELYLVKNNYPQAIKHFEIVLNKFPSSSKAAASTLKIGYALAASGKQREARKQLQRVLKNYPDTPTAQLASIKLRSLGVS